MAAVARNPEIDHLRQEVRRLSHRVYFLLEENDDLRRRVGPASPDPQKMFSPGLRAQMAEFKALMQERDELLRALKRIAQHEVRADRRRRGMVDMDEVEALRH